MNQKWKKKLIGLFLNLKPEHKKGLKGLFTNGENYLQQISPKFK